MSNYGDGHRAADEPTTFEEMVKTGKTLDFRGVKVDANDVRAASRQAIAELIEEGVIETCDPKDDAAVFSSEAGRCYKLTIKGQRFGFHEIISRVAVETMAKRKMV